MIQENKKKLSLGWQRLGTGCAYERTVVPNHLPRTHKNQKLGTACAKYGTAVPVPSPPKIDLFSLLLPHSNNKTSLTFNFAL